MRFCSLILLLIFNQAVPAPAPQEKAGNNTPQEKSGYFAFVDREFIFTVEFVKPGLPLFNFVSMIEEVRTLQAKETLLALENHKVPAQLYLVDTGDPKEPLVVPSLALRPRSSFGVSLRGEYGDAKEIYGARVRVADEDFHLAPLTSFEFENLVLKVNRLNLNSPDFRDDWRVLKLEAVGFRERVRRR
jgi:hypothetical protein